MEMALLNIGHLLHRFTEKYRIRVAVPFNETTCAICDKNLKGEKCALHQKGQYYLFYECFDCHQESEEGL